MSLKANELARELDIESWEASDGWLHCFKHRHGLPFKSVCSESATATPDKWLHKTLPHLLEQYDPSNVCTVDETDLFYQCLAKNPFTFHGESASRAVESKQHLTLLLGANMDASWSLLWLLEKPKIQDVSEVCRLYQFYTSPMPKLE